MPARKQSRKKSRAHAVVEVPVLCRFWQEDGVWNASAVDLPIAVFGGSFEQAQENMTDAILAHLEALQKADELDRTVEYLRSIARDRSVKLNDMALNQSFMRLSAAVQDNTVVAVV